MMNFFRAIGYYVKFVTRVGHRIFIHKTKKGTRYFQDFGLIEVTFLTKSEILAMEAEYNKALEELGQLQKQQDPNADPSAPHFDLGGKVSKLLS